MFKFKINNKKDKHTYNTELQTNPFKLYIKGTYVIERTLQYYIKQNILFPILAIPLIMIHIGVPGERQTFFM